MGEHTWSRRIAEMLNEERGVNRNVIATRILKCKVKKKMENRIIIEMSNKERNLSDL